MLNRACKTPLGNKKGKWPYELIHSPIEMANLLERLSESVVLDQHLFSTLSLALCLDGSDKLFKEYEKYFWEILNKKYIMFDSNMDYFCIKMLEKDMIAIKDRYRKLFHIADGEVIRLKHDLYQPVIILLSSFSLLLGIKVTSNFDKIVALKKAGIISKTLANEITLVLAEILFLRLNNYFFYEKQWDYMIVTNKESIASNNLYKNKKEIFLEKQFFKNTIRIISKLLISIELYIKNDFPSENRKALDCRHSLPFQKNANIFFSINRNCQINKQTNCHQYNQPLYLYSKL